MFVWWHIDNNGLVRPFVSDDIGVINMNLFAASAADACKYICGVARFDQVLTPTFTHPLARQNRTRRLNILQISRS